jgi:hypothetical protein
VKASKKLQRATISKVLSKAWLKTQKEAGQFGVSAQRLAWQIQTFVLKNNLQINSIASLIFNDNTLYIQ